jgi:hypothetical protein
MWYGLVDPATGELKSVGTEAMFPDGNLDAFAGVYDVHAFGANQPDFATHRWSETTRTLEPRPAPVLVDRLDDIEQWLMADPDFAAAWQSMNQTQRTAIRTGIRRVLVRVAGGRRYRQTDEPAELD